MSKLVNSLKESYNEMVHKVSWPTGKELRANSLLVVVGAVIFALLLAGLDSVSSLSTKSIYEWLTPPDAGTMFE